MLIFTIWYSSFLPYSNFYTVSLSQSSKNNSRESSEKSLSEEVLLILKQISALDQNISLLQPNLSVSISSSELFSSDGEASLVTKLTLQKKRYLRRLAKLRRQLDQLQRDLPEVSNSIDSVSLAPVSSCCVFALLGLLPETSCTHKVSVVSTWKAMRTFKAALATCIIEFNSDARKGLDSFLAAFPTLFRSSLLADLKYTKAGPRPGSAKPATEDTPKKKSQKVAIDEASAAILATLSSDQVFLFIILRI